MQYALNNLQGNQISNHTISIPALTLQNIFSDSNFSLPFVRISDYAQYQNITLFSGTCGNSTQESCTTSCLNASVMFSSLETFHNCLLYPLVADLNAHNTSQWADLLGIDKRPDNQTAATITTTIHQCLLEYCGDDDQCKANVPGDDAFYAVNNTSPQIFDFDICQYAAPHSFLDPDVGGVGVSITSKDTYPSPNIS